MTDYEGIVRGFIHCLWKTDGAGLSTFLTDDYFSHESPDSPPGPEGEIAVASSWKSAFPDFDYEVLEVVGDGDRIGVVGRISGTHLGEYEGRPGSGRRFAVKTCDMLTLRDGRICEHRGVYEDALMRDQLGM